MTRDKMTVTEMYSLMICEASNQRVKMSRIEKYHQILDKFFADRLREYVHDNAPEVVQATEARIQQIVGSDAQETQ